MNQLIDVSMAVGPVVGYIHQYYVIQKSRSVGTFSIDICGILLFANILRLNFYVFEKYQMALLFQSIIMILAQICLVRICTKYGFKNKKVKSQSSSQSSFDTAKTENLDNFWRWNLFSTYLLFILFFSFISFSITIIFNQLQIAAYGVMIGLVALLSESVLILPQLLKNCQNQSTKGLSYVLVSLNLFGDIFKLVYFIMNLQPFQFVLCGIIQVILDSFVIIQIFWYRRAKFNDDDKEVRALSPKYSIQHEMKPETEKNLDEIEMENMPQISAEIQQILSLQPVDGFVIQSDDSSPTFYDNKNQNLNNNKPQRGSIKNQYVDNTQQRKDSDRVKEIEMKSNNLLVEVDRSEPLETIEKIQINKAHSEEPLPNSISEGQFLDNKLIHASKSLENIKVEC